jgi:hypothetical protein
MWQYREAHVKLARVYTFNYYLYQTLQDMQYSIPTHVRGKPAINLLPHVYSMLLLTILPLKLLITNF